MSLKRATKQEPEKKPRKTAKKPSRALQAKPARSIPARAKRSVRPTIPAERLRAHEIDMAAPMVDAQPSAFPDPDTVLAAVAARQARTARRFGGAWNGTAYKAGQYQVTRKTIGTLLGVALAFVGAVGFVVRVVDAQTNQYAGPSAPPPGGNIPITIWNRNATTGTQSNASIDISGAITAGGTIATTGGSVGVGTSAPAYPFDLRNAGASGTAEARLNNDNAARLWTGTALARQSVEKWFLGMNNVDDAFRLRRNGATDDLTVDTSGNVSIGNGTLTLASQAADPTGANGRTYYNSASGKFRCYEGGAWKDCIPAAGGVTGSGSGSANIGQIPYWNGATSLAAGSAGFLWDNTNQQLQEVANNSSGPGVVINRTTTSSTASVNDAGMQISHLDSGAIASGTDSSYGLTVSAAHTAAVGGTINTTGILVSATGTAAGTSTNKGIDVTVSGADTNYAALFNGGAVGIGTTAPGFPLDIRNAAASGTAIARLNNDNATKLWTGTVLARQSVEKWFLGVNATDDSLRFRRAGATDDMTIDTSGRVTMAGSALVTTNGSAATAFNVARLGAGDQSWRMYVDDTNAYFDSVQDESNPGQQHFRQYWNSGANGREWMTVASNGDVSISGNTFDANGGGINIPAGGRQVNLSATIPVNIGHSGAEYPSVGYNLNYTGVGGSYTYRGPDTAYLINLGNNDRMGFMTAPSGSTGNAVTFTERMSINSTGVGIGDTAPAYPLSVAGTTNLNSGISSGVALRANGDEALWYNGTYFSWGFGGSANYFRRNVGINTSTPGYPLDVNGNAQIGGGLGVGTGPNSGAKVDVLDGSAGFTNSLNVTKTGFSGTALRVTSASTLEGVFDTSNKFGDGIVIGVGERINNRKFIDFTAPDTWGNPTVERGYIQISGSGVALTTLSDARLKTHVSDFTGALDVIGNIKVRDYEFIENPGVTETGFLAQELYKAWPAAVSPGGADPRKNPWTVDYARLTPLLTRGIQEQQTEIDALQAKVDSLESRLNALEEKSAQ